MADTPAYREKILSIGLSAAIRFNKPGNPGRRSPSFTNDAIMPLVDAIERRLGIPVSNGRPQVLLCHQGDLRNPIAGKESLINIITTDNVGIAIFVNGESWRPASCTTRPRT